MNCCKLNCFIINQKLVIFLLKKQAFSQLDTILCDAELLSDDGQYFLSNQTDIQFSNTDRRVSNKARSGNHSILLEAKNPYGFTFVMENLQPCEKILVSCWKRSSNNSIKAIITMENGSYLQNPNFIVEREEDGWVRQVQEFAIPKDAKTDKASFFLFNPSPEKIYFDDLMIVRIK